MILKCSLTGKKCPIRLEDWYDDGKYDLYHKKCPNGNYKASNMRLGIGGKRFISVENVMCRYFGETRAEKLKDSDWEDV